MKFKAWKFFLIIAGLFPATEGVLPTLLVSQVVYAAESDQIKILKRLFQQEKKTLVNPILNHLASTFEKNQSTLREVAFGFNQLITIDRDYKLGDSERQRQLKELLEDSKAFRRKVPRVKIQLPYSEKVRLLETLMDEGVDPRVIKVMASDPEKRFVNLFGVNATGGVGVGGVGIGISGGTAENRFGKRDARLAFSVGLASPAVAGALNFGRIVNNSECSNKAFSAVISPFQSIAIGAGGSSLCIVGELEILSAVFRGDSSLLDGFSIGFGGGIIIDQRTGMIKLPIPVPRKYSTLRKALRIYYWN